MSDIFQDVRNSSAADIRHFINTNLEGKVNYKIDNGYSVLHFAALNDGNVEIIKVLVSMGAIVNAKADDSRTPLHVALSNKNIEAAETLIDLGADVNISEDSGLTPFDTAIMYGLVRIVEACLSHGANVNPAEQRDLPPPLHMAVLSKKTAGSRNLEIAKLLVAKGADINAKTIAGDTPLDLANKISKDMPMILFLLNNSSIEDITQFIMQNYPDINVQYDNGWTFLHGAVSEGYTNIVKALLAMGVNINIGEENGLTPLDMAIGQGKTGIVDILLPHVSDINARDKLNLTFLHKAAISGRMAGDQNIQIAKLLISYGADINAQAQKGTPLDMAKESGDTAMVKYLSGISAEKEKAEIDRISANYAEALSKNPNDKDTYKVRALVFLSKGYYDQAIADYTRILQLAPDDTEVFRLRGMAYSQKAETRRTGGTDSSKINEYDNAINDFSNIIKLTPDDKEALRFRGMAYFQKKEYDNAISDFSQAIKLKPIVYSDYLNLGLVYRAIQQNKYARQYLERVLELNPDNTTISITNNLLNEINKEEQEQKDREFRIEQEKREQEEHERREAEEREQQRINTVKRKKRLMIFIAAIGAILVALIGFIIYNSQENSLIIPESKTIIKQGEFSGKQLVSVIIPDSVTSIENNAFKQNKLTAIVIPDSVTQIGENALAKNKITSIIIGSGVLLGSNAVGSGFETFYKKNGFSAGNYRRSGLKSNEWRVWYNNFEYQFNNEEISIIGYNGTSREIEIPDEISGYPVRIIGKRAFYENNFTRVIIPDSIITIEEMAFFGLWDRDKGISLGAISNITIGNNVTTIEDRVFENNLITEIIIPNSVTSIGYSAFADNPVTSIKIGANVSLGSGDSGQIGILGRSTGFNTAYSNNSNRAGIYTRVNTESTAWTRR